MTMIPALATQHGVVMELRMSLLIRFQRMEVVAPLLLFKSKIIKYGKPAYQKLR